MSSESDARSKPGTMLMFTILAAYAWHAHGYPWAVVFWAFAAGTALNVGIQCAVKLYHKHVKGKGEA